MKTPSLKACMLHGAAALILAVPMCARAEPPGFASPWVVEVTPYLWSSGLSGNARIGGASTANYSDDGGKPDSGFLSIEAGQGDSGLILDVFHTKLAHDSVPFPDGSGSVNNRIDGRQDVFQLTGVARGARDLDLFIDFIGGVRYMSIDAGQQVAGGTRFSDKVHWANGFIGFRFLQQISERWWLVTSADVGGGVNTQSWSGQLGLDYRITNAATFKMGAKVLGLKYDKPEFTYDQRTGGLYAGLGVRF
jgi:hypothetical protein